MASVLVILASLLSSLVNLMTKRNLDKVGTIQGYLVVYFLFSFLSSFLISPDLFKTEISLNMISAGAVVGVLVFVLMLCLARALESGPPGLIFAFQNSSSVIPSILLFLAFGTSFGFIMTPSLIAGLLCVMGGLFWGANTQLKSSAKQVFQKKWLVYALFAFLIQASILSIFFWKTLVIDYSASLHPLLFIQSLSEEESWFMPGLFFSAAILSLFRFMRRDRSGLKKPEVFYGIIGGLLNGGATYLLLLGAKLATPVEKGILFPLNAICIIIFCSLWGQKLYQEKVNWLAILLCLIGILLGTI